FVSSRSRHTTAKRDWRSDVCSSDLVSCVASSSQHIPEVGVGLSSKPRLQPERECAGDQQFERDSKQTVIELVDKTEGGSRSIKGARKSGGVGKAAEQGTTCARERRT